MQSYTIKSQKMVDNFDQFETILSTSTAHYHLQLQDGQSNQQAITCQAELILPIFRPPLTKRPAKIPNWCQFFSGQEANAKIAVISPLPATCDHRVLRTFLEAKPIECDSDDGRVMIVALPPSTESGMDLGGSGFPLRQNEPTHTLSAQREGFPSTLRKLWKGE